MISTYKVPKYDTVPNRTILGNKYYFRRWLATEVKNRTNTKNPNNCTLNPPPVP